MLIENITNICKDFVDYDSHEKVYRIKQDDVGLHAIVALHNSKLGPTLGGTRFYPYQTEMAGIKDVLRLSRGMTYKAASAGLNLGGAKAVIIGEPKVRKTEKLLHAYGESLNRLNERRGVTFYSGEDIGMNVADCEIIKEVTGFVGGSGKDFDPSPLTAHGVYIGILTAMEHRYGPNANFINKTFLIEGLGNVGFQVAELIHRAGGNLLVCDINENKVKKFKDHIASISPDACSVKEVGTEDKFYHDFDVYVPCAMGGVIRENNYMHIHCDIIAGAANNQMEDRTLHINFNTDTDILYAPDYVINAGGLISIDDELFNKNKSEVSEHYVYKQVEFTIRNNLRKIFKIAEKNKISTVDVANILAESRFV